MKDTKKSSTNNEKLQQLGSLFAQTINQESLNAREQIEQTRNASSELKKQSVKTNYKENTDKETAPKLPPEISISKSLEIPKNIEKNQSKNVEVVETKNIKKLGEPLRLSTYLLGPDVEKLKNLRKYLVQNGINSSITDSQLVRLAVKKLKIDPDVIDFYSTVYAEDGRKHRSPL